MVADLVGFTLSEPAILEKLTGQQRNILQKFVDKLVSMFGDKNMKAAKEYLSNADGDIRAIFKDVAREADSIAEQFKAAIDTSQKAEKNTVERDGVVRNSLVFTSKGKTVWIDEDITKNKPKDVTYTEFVGNYIADMIDGNETYIESLPESGMPVYANEDLAGEFTNSKYTKRLRNKKHDKFYAKMKLAKSLDELVKIATGRNWEKAIHTENKDAKYGIYKYKSRFAFPNINDMGEVKSVSAYTCDVLIINASNGKKYLYDVLNIKEDVASADELLKKELARAKNAQAGDISNNNYTQKNGNVNRNSKDISNALDDKRQKSKNPLENILAERFDPKKQDAKMLKEIFEDSRSMDSNDIRDENGKIRNGTVVYAFDRENFGWVTGYDYDENAYWVYFISPDGYEAEPLLHSSDVKPVKEMYFEPMPRQFDDEHYEQHETENLAIESLEEIIEVERIVQQIKSSDDLSDADVQAIREEITQSRKQQREQLLAEIATTNLARWGAELGK